jgi:hypothetical protein
MVRIARNEEPRTAASETKLSRRGAQHTRRNLCLVHRGFETADLKDAKALLDELKRLADAPEPRRAVALTEIISLETIWTDTVADSLAWLAFILHNLLSAGLSAALPQGGWGRALLPNIDQSTGLAFE